MKDDLDDDGEGSVILDTMKRAHLGVGNLELVVFTYVYILNLKYVYLHSIIVIVVAIVVAITTIMTVIMIGYTCYVVYMQI